MIFVNKSSRVTGPLKAKGSNQQKLNYLLSLLNTSPEKPESLIPNMVHRKRITVTSETFIKANQYLHKEGII